jgi:hypothetical protein
MTMKLARFLNYFSRVVSTNPKDPTVCFYVGDDQHEVRSVEFDVATNVWKVNLNEKAKAATDRG